MSRFQIELDNILSDLINNHLEQLIIPIDLMDTQLIYSQIKYDKLKLNNELQRIIIGNCFSLSIIDNSNINIIHLVHKIRELLNFKISLKANDFVIQSRYIPIVLDNIDTIIHKYDTFFHGKIKNIHPFDYIWMYQNKIKYCKNEKYFTLGTEKVSIRDKSLFIDNEEILTHECLIRYADIIDNFIVFLDFEYNLFVNGKKIGFIETTYFRLYHLNKVPYAMYIYGSVIKQINLIDKKVTSVSTNGLFFDIMDNKYIIATEYSVWDTEIKIDNHVRILNIRAVPDGIAVACSDWAIRVYSGNTLRYTLNVKSPIIDMEVLITDKDYKIACVCSNDIIVWC